MKDLGRRAFVEVSSGDVDVESVEGDVHLLASSGDAVISRVGGSVSARATSGDVEVYSIAGDVDAERDLIADVSVEVVVDADDQLASSLVDAD